MLMYEMYGVAQDNNRVYECPYGTFNYLDGFKLNSKANKLKKEDLLTEMCTQNFWKVKDDRKLMSLEEIEKELGYKIRLKEYEYYSYEDAMKILECIFGG